MRPEDIYTDGDIVVLKIHDEAPGATIKNAASVREIPLHPACADLLAHLEEVRGAGNEWVFSSLPNWATGRAGKFHQLATRFLRDRIGIEDKRVTAHSTRHYWRYLANEIEMPGVISRSIIGHSLGKDDHDGTYASTPSLRKRYDWLSKIDPTAG